MDRDEVGGQTAKGGEEEPGRAVSAELSRCLLTEGEYELVLDDNADTATKISPNKKNSSREIINAETASMSSSQFSVFSHFLLQKEKVVKTSKTTSENVCWLSDRDNCEIIVKYAE